jgi:Protein of unknown function (DUF2752)
MSSTAAGNAFGRVLHEPAFSDLLSDRRTAAIIVGAGALHVCASLIGINLWSCPFRAATGIPCPGCFLTTAILDLLHGKFSASIQAHAFAPIFLAVLAFTGITVFLPEEHRQRLLSALRNYEVLSGITTWVLIGLMLYWVLRLMGIIPFPKIF